MSTAQLIKCSPRSGLEVGIVEVPRHSTGFDIDYGGSGLICHGEYVDAGYIQLPPGSYTFLFCSNNVTEEECKEMIKPVKGYGYRNYEKEDYNGGHSPFDVWSAYHFKTALESLQSLLRSLGLDPSLNYACLLINKK